MLKILLTVLSISWMATSWAAGHLNLKIHFDQIYGLKPGDRIIFEQNDIGRVTGIRYERAGAYLAEAEIFPDFRNAVTDRSQFFVTEDPAHDNRKAVEMLTVKGEGVPLSDGAVVAGATRFSVVLKKMEDDVARGLSDLKESFNRFSEDFKDLPDQDETKRLQKYLDQLLESMKRSGTAFREMVQKDLLPRLQEAIEKLKERLKRSGREKEVEPLQTKMDEMRKI